MTLQVPSHTLTFLDTQVQQIITNGCAVVDDRRVFILSFRNVFFFFFFFLLICRGEAVSWEDLIYTCHLKIKKKNVCFHVYIISVHVLYTIAALVDHFFLLLFWGKGIVLSIRIYMVRISTEPFAVENLESVRITTQSKYSWNT